MAEIPELVPTLRLGMQSPKLRFETGSGLSGSKDFLKQLDSKIILIDGERLTELMLDHDIGVSPFQTYAIKRADSDYFEEA